MNRLFKLIFWAIILFPLSLIIAFLVGGEIEQFTGIESIGHTGPALWLILLIYSIFLGFCWYQIYLKKDI
jgi:hypothetical protein